MDSPEVTPIRHDTGEVAADAAAEETVRTVGRYRLFERLGEGGMGVVIRGYDAEGERWVALKHVAVDGAAGPQAKERFRREARLAARLDHPMIVKIHDFVETPAGDWFVMELVEGRTLLEVVREDGPLPEAKVAVLGAAIAEGLAAAHAAGVVHRDLKLENVMLTPSGLPRILDFGVAKSFEEGDDSLTQDGQIIGTVDSMSPEQALGDRLDGRSDLFSLGSLLYELASGLSPFRDQSKIQTLRQICLAHQRALWQVAPDVSRELSDLIDYLLQKDPALRPQTALEVVHALRHCAERVGGVGAGTAVLDVLEASHLDETAADPALRAPGARRPRPSDEASGVVSRDESWTRPTERRRVTVLLAELAAPGGPEADVLYEAMPHFRAAAEDVVERRGGCAVSLLGHCLVACFGHEEGADPADAARRAVEAGFDLLWTMRELAEDWQLEGLDLRTALHTGAAVVVPGDDPNAPPMSRHGSEIVLGSALDRLTTLHAEVATGQLWLSEQSRDLLSTEFEWQEGEVAVAGESVQVYRAVRRAG